MALKRFFVKVVLLCVCVCSMPLWVMGQSAVQGGDSEESRFKAEDFGFNAIDVRQSRFLYGDSAEYRNRRFYDNLSVGVVWHYDKIHERMPQGYKGSLNYGLFIEKELSKLHSLRLLFYEGSYQQRVRPVRMNKYQIELMHSFNWTRFFGGYNPYRRLDAVTSLGVGAFCSERVDKVKVGPMLIAGAGARIQLSPLFVLGVEPYVALASDSIDHSGNMNYRKYDVLYGLDVSLAYTFHEEKFRREAHKRYAGKTFVDFGLGVQLEPYVGFHLHPNEVPFFATAGPKLKLGVGHWVSPEFAVRAAANLSSSNWDNVHIEANMLTNHPAYDIQMKNVLANGRIDLLFNPYYTFTGRNDNRFGINAVVGWEYGWMIKTAYDPEDMLSKYYDGFSGGLQLRYNYDEYTALYLEPRLTLANYSIPYAAPYEEYVKHYRDYLLSVTAGLEFGANEFRFSGRAKQPSPFTPHFSVSLQGGLSHLFLTKEYVGDFYIDYSAGLAGEMQLTPYSGVRVMADYSRLSNRDIYPYTQRMIVGENTLLSDTALCIGKYGFVNVSADYMFDLGTLLQGYDEANRWDVAFAIGPVFSQRMSERAVVSKDEMLWEFRGDNPVATAPKVDHSRVARRSLGLQLGIPVSYRIGSRIDVRFEPRARFFSKDYVKQSHYQGFTKILNAQLGLRYTLNERYGSIVRPQQYYDYRHDFVNYAIGIQYAAGSGIPFGSTGGIQLGLGAGRWLHSLWGVRFGAEVAASHIATIQSSGTGLLLKSARFCGRADLMVNPLALNRAYLPSRWGAALLLGWELGGKVDAKYTDLGKRFYNSLSLGAQLRYHTDGHHAIYIEPRYTLDDHLLSMTAGLEFAMTEHRFRSRKYQPDAFIPHYSIGFSGGVNHLLLPCVYAGSRQLDFDLGFSGEYRFTPYSGARLTLDYSRLANGTLLDGQLVNYGIGHLNMGVDYMLDLSTLFAGYTSNRCWEVSLAAGPVLSARVAADKGHAQRLNRFALGAQFGIPVQYRFTERLGILLEPRFRMFGPDYAAPRYTIGGFTSKILNVQMGMKYTF